MYLSAHTMTTLMQIWGNMGLVLVGPSCGARPRRWINLFKIFKIFFSTTDTGRADRWLGAGLGLRTVNLEPLSLPGDKFPYVIFVLFSISPALCASKNEKVKTCFTFSFSGDHFLSKKGDFSKIFRKNLSTKKWKGKSLRYHWYHHAISSPYWFCWYGQW